MTENYITRNPYFNDGKYIAPQDLKGFILHSVGVGQPDPLVFIRSWDNPGYTNAGISGFIGADKTYLTAPCMDPARVKRMPHAGKQWINDHYIGFEMTEPAQIHYTGGDCFTVSDREAARRFVKSTYQQAVRLFAALCHAHGKDPLSPGVILSHNEAGRQGIATGHTDPEHLWRGLGLDYTMDGFRQAVRNHMQEEIAMTKQELEALIDARIQAALRPEHQTVPNWAKQEFADAIAAGITDGTNPNAVPTRLETALMAYRAGKKG